MYGTQRAQARAAALRAVGWEMKRNCVSNNNTSDYLPSLCTIDEVAATLRKTRKAVYAMVERQQIPGVLRVGRRVLFDQQTIVRWLRQKSSPSSER
jgi:excisionase family DNA binding protein